VKGGTKIKWFLDRVPKVAACLFVKVDAVGHFRVPGPSSGDIGSTPGLSGPRNEIFGKPAFARSGTAKDQMYPGKRFCLGHCVFLAMASHRGRVASPLRKINKHSDTFGWFPGCGHESHPPSRFPGGWRKCARIAQPDTVAGAASAFHRFPITERCAEPNSFACSAKALSPT
tara:strand:- start:1838 stop:2353 length:516 start_codon:yes stop_codon:yes gene_type:complete